MAVVVLKVELKYIFSGYTFPRYQGRILGQFSHWALLSHMDCSLYADTPDML